MFRAPEYVRSWTGALHDLASNPLGFIVLIAIGMGGLLALVLATKGARVSRGASVRRTAVLLGGCMAAGLVVAWASGSISTHVSYRGVLEGEPFAIDRSGWPAYFLQEAQISDTIPNADRDLPVMLIDVVFWAGCAGFALAFRETGRARYLPGEARSR